MAIIVSLGEGNAFRCRRGIVEAIATIVSESNVRSATLTKAMTEEELERFNAIGGFILDRWAKEDLVEFDAILAAIEAGQQPVTTVWTSEWQQDVLHYVRKFRTGLQKRLSTVQ